ncbi:neutral zinc metallopeptidase [Actinomadura gamaensis]|uniref:Neutral zinc metallopeptidase n=1 Tax=Actinomadura gamaensis TaxID=1763541 RepID=A0ABV9UBS4_9ACTN
MPPRRPPRRSAGGTVAGVIGGFAALGVILIVILSAVSSNHPTVSTGGGGVTARGQQGSGGGSGAPQTATRATATNNKLYSTGALTSVSCHLPALDQSPDSMRRFMNQLSDCLDATWKAQFGKIDMSFAPPNRVFWLSPGNSPCGNYPAPGSSAFYCPANNTMYVGLKHVIETSGDESVAHFAVFARVIAHEYGHHVQDRAGILLYGDHLMDQSDPIGRAEASRRIELQAQCFAGEFLGANRTTLPLTQDQYNALILDVQGRGDENQPVDKRDHGSGKHYAGWVVRGIRTQDLSVCNTWSAPPSAVS